MAGKRQLVAIEVGEDSIVVRPTGDLDADTAPAFGEALHEALAHTGGPTTVIVDLSGIRFSDSAGLNVLVRGRLQARNTARDLRLHAPKPQMIRLLELSGADAAFDISAG